MNADLRQNLKDGAFRHGDLEVFQSSNWSGNGLVIQRGRLPIKEEAAKNLAQWEKWEKGSMRYGPGESHGLPYRCLIPADLTNVLVAGRSVSCEKTVQGSIRVMPVCQAMGEAAGTAAAMAAATNTLPKNINTQALRERLKINGAYLPD